MSALLYQMRADSPAGLWPLQETSGTTAFDYSNNGRNGTYNGSYVLNSSMGPFRGLDLTGGYVDIPDNAAFSSHAGAAGVMTLEAWGVWDTLTSLMALFTKGNAANYEWEMGLQYTVPTGLNVTVWNLAATLANGVSSGAGFVSVGELVHLMATYDKAANQHKLYKNGTLLTTATTSTTTSGDGSSTVRIGSRSDGGDPVHDGRVGWVGYYPSVLSADRIMSHYKAGIRSGVMVG